MKYWDKAWSLVSGCTPISPACDNCWLKAIDTRFGKEWDGNIQTHPERLELPLKTKKPTTWAIWSDLFHESVPEAFIDKAFGIMLSRQEHTFLICTKRPERMADYIVRLYRHLIDTDERQIGIKRYEAGEEFQFKNIIIGTTVENQEMADKRIPELLKCSPFKLFLSVEPMLERIKLPIYYCDAKFASTSKPDCPICGKHLLSHEKVDKIIAGCESGHPARETKIEWIKDLFDQCKEAGVPLWVKQIRELPPKGIGSYHKHKQGKMVYDYQELSTIKKEDLWKWER